jgi:hypothetical protein
VVFAYINQTYIIARQPALNIVCRCFAKNLGISKLPEKAGVLE